jgi:hypothetical protein
MHRKHGRISSFNLATRCIKSLESPRVTKTKLPTASYSSVRNSPKTLFAACFASNLPEPLPSPRREIRQVIYVDAFCAQKWPRPARRSESAGREFEPLRFTGLLSQRDTGATRSRRKSYFFINRTLPSASDCVRKAEKKYRQSRTKDCATSLQ